MRRDLHYSRRAHAETERELQAEDLSNTPVSELYSFSPSQRSRWIEWFKAQPAGHSAAVCLEVGESVKSMAH